jgi:hypothetical protein
LFGVGARVAIAIGPSRRRRLIGEMRLGTPEMTGKLWAYARCMRDSGVPGFPDPMTDGGLIVDGSKRGFDSNSVAFKAADQKCRHLMPAPVGGAAGSRDDSSEEGGA